MNLRIEQQFNQEKLLVFKCLIRFITSKDVLNIEIKLVYHNWLDKICLAGLRKCRMFITCGKYKNKAGLLSKWQQQSKNYCNAKSLVLNYFIWSYLLG